MDAYAVTPVLNVSDLTASLAWFRALGWETRWTWEGELGMEDFAAVGSGRCEIFLCLDDQGGRDESGAWLAVFVPDVAAVAESAALVGAEVVQAATDMPWGVRELHLRHPDGHVLRISQEGLARDHADEWAAGHEHRHDSTD
jgi:predicted enzyme related to lactoylglutathione lyase